MARPRSSLAAASARRRPKRPRRLVRPGERPTEPRAAELQYTAALRAFWFRAQVIILSGLLPLLDAWPKREETADARDYDLAFSRDLRRWIARASGLEGTLPPHVRPGQITSVEINRAIGDIKLRLGHWIRSEDAGLTRLIQRAAGGVDRHVADDLGRILTIDLRRDEPTVASLINGFRERNINLIESGIMAPLARPRLRPSLLADVSRTVEEAHASGLRVEGLAAQLRDRFEVSDSRAELIARDQVLKLNGQINQARQTAAGVTRYRWSTSKDERVRVVNPKTGRGSDHAHLEGTPQSWDAPPITNESTGETNHPGEDYQCRCIAIPIEPTEAEGGYF
jgi:SPP1 gp7 family putative phage head morphogenesis protein